MNMINFLATSAADLVCGDASDIVVLIGKVVTVFQIAIPILLVIFGLVNLGKAVVSSKDDEIKKATSGLIKKIIFAAAIFFVVTLVKMVIGLVSSSTKESMGTCWDIIADPWNEKWTKSTDSSNNTNNNG